MADPHAPRHPIRVVSERTGLSQDLLRAWEKRYGAVAPPRRAGARQRLYSDDDVERLRLLRQVTAAGRAIGQVASLPTAELRRMAGEDEAARLERGAPARTPGHVGAPAPLERALAQVHALDAAGLEATLMRALVALDAESFVHQLVLPLLHGTGDGWAAGTLGVAHEHASTAVIRRVLAFATDAAAADADAPEIVVAAPAGQRHDLGAQLAAFTAAGAGWRVTFLGADVPVADIAQAARQRGAQAVAVGIVLAAVPSLADELRALRAALPPSTALLAGGPGTAALEPELSRLGVRVLASLAELRHALRHPFPLP